MLLRKAVSSFFCLGAIAAAAGLASAQVTISQVYGSGGNQQSPTRADYIEIYNSGAPQDVTGWSVQYASSTGTTWAVAALPSVILGTGQYLLVKEASGTTLIAGQAPELPTPDATFTTSMSGTDFKIALVSSTTALVGGLPTYVANPTLVDLVGAGTANWNDASAAGAVHTTANNAPPASTAHAIYRRNCGAMDTNVSKDDWAVGFPAARNTATALSNGLTVIGTALPLTLKETQTARLLATAYLCGTESLGAGTTLSVDLTAIGGGATAMVDDGTSGDEIANDGLYTALATVAAGTPVGTACLPVTATDGGGNSGGSYICLQVRPLTSPDNDNCTSAIAVTVPSVTTGIFTDATVESNSISATTGGMLTKKGVWYTVVGTGNTLTASLCGTLPALDSVINVLAGTCDGLTVIAANDDGGIACTGSAASAAWCSELGSTYFVWIAPYSSTPSTAAFQLDITDDGVACGTALPVNICTGSAGPFSEVEPGFGIHTNDGCLSSPNRFTDIATPGYPATVLRGTARGMLGNRDADSYRFLATTSDVITITIDTLGSQAQAQLYSLSAGGACPQTNIANTTLYVWRCATGIQTLTSSVTAGNWYTVQVVGGIGLQVAPSLATVFGGQMPGGTTDQYTLSIAIGGTPPNNDCANASALSGASVGANLALATNDGTSSCDATGTDVWYSYTNGSPASGTLSLDTCGSTTDTVISVFDTCGGTELACNDDATGVPCGGPASALSMVLTGGQSVVIRVSDKGLGGSFTMNWSFFVPPPVNDDPCGAITVVDGVNPYSTVAATTTTAPASCTSISRDVWYSYTASLTGTMTVTNCPASDAGASNSVASWDSVIAVYDATPGCASLGTAIVCADGGGACSYYESLANVAVVAGNTYLIRIGPYGSTQPASYGTFVIIPPSPPPANDDCAAATAITGSGAFAFDNRFATPASGGFATNCGTSNSKDVWYLWTSEGIGSTTVDVCGVSSWDSVIAIYDGTGCPVSSATEVACNDDMCGLMSSVTFTVAPCTNYYIRVMSYSTGAGIAGTLNIAAPGPDTDGDGTIDCLDGCPSDPLKIAPGICGCGVVDVDTDGDGTYDCFDGCPTDPAKTAPGQCGCGVADTDTDGDGTADCNDGCPSDPAKIAPGQCGCGVADTDTDGDGTADCNDGCPTDPAKLSPGQCGCGTPDTDTDGDGTADCNDGCPTDPAKTAPGQCGCGNLETDTDADGVADCVDNCVAIANPTQGDCDLDGIGDACEIAAGAFDTNANGIPDECELGVVFNYCTAGTSSNGCSATMSAAGVPSAAATSGFVLTASGAEGSQSALMYYGVTGPTAKPFGGGSGAFICVKTPFSRLMPVQTTTPGLCTGSISVDFLMYTGSHPSAVGVPLFAGEVISAQCWYRDPPSTKTANLSDGLQWTMLP